MLRDEIEQKYQWDLSTLFINQEAYDKQRSDASNILKELVAMKGSITTTLERFVSFMNQYETLVRYINNLYSYASMSNDVEPNSDQAQKNKASSQLLYQRIFIELSFFDSEIINHKEIVEEYLSEDVAKDFRYPIVEILRTIPHRLDEETENLLAQYQQVAMNPQETYDAFRLEFPSVIIDGKEEFLNEATYHEFLRNKDVNVRKQAYENIFNEYKRFENVFCSTLSGHAKGQVLNARVHKYESALQASLFDDGVTPELFHKVLDITNVKFRKNLHDYYQFRKDYLELTIQHPYDLAVPLIDQINVKYRVDECFEILNKALAPLGEEYVNLLKRAKDERWIDFMTHSGKRTGAYSGGSYDSNPFILMNFTGGYDSLSTLAHELGHSMHSYYSRKNNRPLLSSYRIFVAEVASTVNEILLNKYLLANSEDETYKSYILENLLEQLVGTLYRQPMFAQFEAFLHESIEKDEPISTSTLTTYYFDLSKDYYGISVETDDLERYKCYYVPHFYYNFYVYKYTLGMAVALSFVKKILAGDTKDYLHFLSKGGSESPVEELINAGVDPQSEHVYEDAFNFFQETLDEFKQILKK